MKSSPLEDLYLYSILALGLPEPVRELRFAPPRRYRFDFAWPEHMLAVEVQGGTARRGRHVRVSGYEKDREKMHLAMLNGWRVYEFTTRHIRTGLAADVTAKALVAAGVVLSGVLS